MTGTMDEDGRMGLQIHASGLDVDLVCEDALCAGQNLVVGQFEFTGAEPDGGGAWRGFGLMAKTRIATTILIPAEVQ